MKTIAVVFLAWAVWGFSARGGAPGGSVSARNTPAGNVKDQAARMGQALIDRDYKTFIHYTWPGLIKLAGGEGELTEQLNRLMDQMKAKGMVFSGVSFGAVSAMVSSGNELQCTVPQHTEIKLSGGRMVSTSTLIAISTDKGSNWTFVDTSNKDISTIRKLLPHLSSAIVIPPQQPPLRYAY
jgi:hypothetical protein